MKYCKKCKIAAKETDTVCSKCKQPVSSFGSSPSPAGSAGPKPATPGANPAGPTGPKPSTSQAMFTLSGQIEQLEELKSKNLRRGRTLGILSILATLAILFIIFQVYSRTVLAYAVLENIKFEQDPIAENQITVSFDVKSPGKVAFDRQSGTGHTEKVDLITRTKKGHETVWAWPSDPKTGIDFSVVYRGGWLLDSKDKHFDVTRDGIGVEVVFIMDITNSMGPFIQGLKENCNDFANQVRKRGLDCRLGLIGFGDVEYNEPLRFFDLTSDVKVFQSNVSELDLVNGVDIPESSVEALERGLEMTFRPHTRVCFVHITDADCHHPERLSEVASQLKKQGILTYSISRRQLGRLYKPICVNGGTFHDINGSNFETILQEIARSIVNQISSN
jgi:hypothetical protein